jgi:hypothetical protein
MNDYISVLKKIPYKIALPQDEYDNPLLRDRFLYEINVDEIHTNFLNQKQLLYPKCNNLETKFFLAFTGYIDDRVINYSNLKWKNDNRKYSVTYRTQTQSYKYGKIGQLKTDIADFFNSKASLFQEPLNISYNPKDVLLGTDWYDFLLNSKYVLGSLSGSSNIDFLGRIKSERLEQFVDDVYYKNFYPESEFTNVELTAISPRNLEAALMGCCQINIESEYGGFFIPWKHYIPLKRDFSNFKEVLNAMNDDELVIEIVKNSREMVLSSPEFKLSELVKGIRNRALISNKSKKIKENKYSLILLLNLYILIQNLLVFRILWIRTLIRNFVLKNKWS